MLTTVLVELYTHTWYMVTTVCWNYIHTYMVTTHSHTYQPLYVGTIYTHYMVTTVCWNYILYWWNYIHTHYISTIVCWNYIHTLHGNHCMLELYTHTTYQPLYVGTIYTHYMVTTVCWNYIRTLHINHCMLELYTHTTW